MKKPAPPEGHIIHESFWGWVACLFKGHLYEKVDRGPITDMYMCILAAMEPSLKTHYVNGKLHALDLVCKRCGKIDGFKESLKGE